MMQTTDIGVQGMTCMGCAASVKRVVGEINGVTATEVSLEKAQATVTYDPDKVSLSEIKSAISDAGYDVA